MLTRTLRYFLTTVISCTTVSHALCQQANDEPIEETTRPNGVNSDKDIIIDKSETAEFRQLMDRIIINHDVKIQESFGDWEVTCDNLGTCRAAGYHSDESIVSHESDEIEYLVSVLLYREAKGVLSEPKAYIQIGSPDIGNSPFTFMMPNQNLGRLKKVKKEKTIDIRNQLDDLFLLNKKQTRALWNYAQSEMLSDEHKYAVVKSKQGEWKVSLKGLREATQLIKNYHKDYDKRKKPRIPIIFTQPFPNVKTKITAEELSIIAERVKVKYCRGSHDPIKIFHLNTTDYLVFSGCQLAYQSAPLVLARRAAGSKLLEVDISEKFSAEVMLDEHGIEVRAKGRGIGDCWFGENYVWNGKAFEMTASWSTGMCKGVAGGFWTFPSFISEVKNFIKKSEE